MLNTAAQAQSPATVTVTSFHVEGNTLLTNAEIEAVLHRYEGQKMTFQGMRGVADALTRAYQNKGYFTVRALLPQQTIGSDGVVRLTVVQNKLGQFKVHGKPVLLREADSILLF